MLQGMDDASIPLVSSFIIRFVVNETPDGTVYRGTARHIQTAEEITFVEWREALDFMRRFVPLTDLLSPSSRASNS